MCCMSKLVFHPVSKKQVEIVCIGGFNNVSVIWWMTNRGQANCGSLNREYKPWV